MRAKYIKPAACTLISAFLLSGCSYFPAKMPDIFPTDENLFSPQTTTASVQTVPQETAAIDPAKAAILAYKDFIAGKNKISTSGCFDKKDGKTYLDLRSGSYSFEEMKKALKFDQAWGSVARYAMVDCGRDGIYELAVCFDRLDHTEASVIIIIGYDNGNLIMNAFFEESVPNEYRLYDSGHLESSTMPVRGIHKKVLIRAEEGGKCSKVFEYNEYQGSYAVNILKHLNNFDEEAGKAYENLPSDFFVRELVSNGQVIISVTGWSESESDRRLEQELVQKIKTLDAEEVTVNKMKELSSTEAYTVKEVAWTDCNSGKETQASSVGIAKAAGNFNITVYLDPESSEYSGLGTVVNVLNSGSETDMRFVSDSDDVTVILEKGSWDMNKDEFAAQKEIFNVKTKAGLVYQFNCTLGDVFPYYRIRAVKGSFVSEWLVLKGKDSKVTVIKSSFSGDGKNI